MQLKPEEMHLNQIMFKFKPEFDETQTVPPQRSRAESQPSHDLFWSFQQTCGVILGQGPGDISKALAPEKAVAA